MPDPNDAYKKQRKSLLTPKHHDAFYLTIEENIRKFGVHLLGVYPTPGKREPGFTYTIGLFEKVGYEVILFSIPFEFAGIILNDVTKSVIAGHEMESGRIYTAKENPWVRAPVKFEKCKWDKAKDYVVQAYRYYKVEPEVMTTYQMVVPDRQMRMPEDPNFEHDYMDIRQPLLY